MANLKDNDTSDFDFYEHVKRNLIKNADYSGSLPYHNHTSGVFYILCTLYHLKRIEAKAVLRTLARRGEICLLKRRIILLYNRKVQPQKPQ